MEELRNSRRCSQLKEKPKSVQETKIAQLHNLIQSYLANCNQKKVNNMLPIIESAKMQKQIKQRQLQQLNQQMLSAEELEKLQKSKKMLIKNLNNLSKKVKNTKNAIKQMKIRKEQLQKQIIKNDIIYKQLETKLKKLKMLNYDVVQTKPNRIFPRISGLNFELLHKDIHKKIVVNSILGSNTDRSQNRGDNDDKQNYFNSASYKKLREIDSLLDQITIDSPINTFEKQLTENNQKFNIRAVFKNFSIQQYFDHVLKNKKIRKILINIQNS